MLGDPNSTCCPRNPKSTENVFPENDDDDRKLIEEEMPNSIWLLFVAILWYKKNNLSPKAILKKLR